MDLELGGKVVLVTGGSDGLGAAVAAGLVREGARVALCARGAERLEATAAALRGLGGEVLAQVADVTRPEDVDRFVEAFLVSPRASYVSGTALNVDGGLCAVV